MQVFILDGTTPVGVLGDSYEKLEWVRRLWQPNKVTLDLNLRQLHATQIQKGRILWLAEDNVAFLIEHIETNDEPGAAKDAMRVIGRSIDAIATEERLANPAPGDSHDTQSAVTAEAAIKHYVDANAGPSASAAREIPDFTVAASGGAGAVVSVAARYQLVGDILREIGYAAGMGWETSFDPDTGSFVFDVVSGVDRTASVFFDTAFDTLERYSELDSLIDTKTHAVVAGQGEGVDREIVERFLGSEKTGLDRRETFIDARDVEPGATDILEQRGDSTLEALQAQARYEATVHPYGSFRYREHWDLGDLVTLRDADRGVSAPVRVVAVTSSITNSKATPERQVELDRPFPTLKDRVGGSTVSGGAVDSPLSLPPDAHAASHARGASDTLAAQNIDVSTLRIGADVDLSRGAADRLDLASGDSLRIVGGQLQVGADLVLSRGAADRLDLASGDSLRLVSGELQFSTDVNLYKSAANTLKTDDNFEAAHLSIGSNRVARYVRLGTFIDTFSNQSKVGSGSGLHTMSALPAGAVAAHGVLFHTGAAANTYFAISDVDDANAYGGIQYTNTAGVSIAGPFTISLNSSRQVWLSWSGTQSGMYVRVIGYWTTE